jgi:hypothetical protein
MHEALMLYDVSQGVYGPMCAPWVLRTILDCYSELEIVSKPPAWMTQDAEAHYRERALGIDEPPSGLLRAILNLRGDVTNV